VNLWEKFRKEFSHAFALEPQIAQLSEGERLLLEKAAKLIVQRNMTAPALLFLESLGPLHFLGSQIAHGLKPFLDMVCNPIEIERLAVLLERRDSIDQFILCIQEQANSPA
jgi:hypothetical protein